MHLSWHDTPVSPTRLRPVSSLNVWMLNYRTRFFKTFPFFLESEQWLHQLPLNILLHSSWLNRKSCWLCWINSNLSNESLHTSHPFRMGLDSFVLNGFHDLFRNQHFDLWHHWRYNKQNILISQFILKMKLHRPCVP